MAAVPVPAAFASRDPDPPAPKGAQAPIHSDNPAGTDAGDASPSSPGEGPTETEGEQSAGAGDQPAPDAVDADILADPIDLTDVTTADELLLFADLPVVISGTRQEQPIAAAGVPVTIITGEDIHYSGLTNIPELLQFATGVDSLRLDRNRYAVGVRGLHHEFADRTLVLIDGRNAGSPVFGGPDFLALPVFMEDIERIEIVRGPGGAAWGANAFNGVINIITKSPEDARGFFASSTLTRFNDSFNHVRWGDAAGRLSWRLSFGYDSHVSSLDAIGIAAGLARDFSRTYRFDGRGVYRLSDRSRLSFGLGHSHLDRGDFELAGFFPMRNERIDLLRAFARFDHEFDGGASLYFQWFGNFESSNRPSISRIDSFENDLEAQFNFSAGESHEISVGGNFRFVHIDPRRTDAQSFAFRDAPFDEYWIGLFGIDRWRVTDRVTLETQLRGDYYSATRFDWSGRVAALFALDEKKSHILRLGAATAFRAPLPGVRESGITRGPLPTPPFPPDSFAITMLRADDLKAERIWSLEAGYNARLAEGLMFRADGYYHRYEDLIGIDLLPSPEPFVVVQPANLGGADGYGAELELSQTGQAGKLSVWYAFNDFRTDNQGQDTRSFFPARHKVGATGRLFLPHDFAVNLNYRYTDVTGVNKSLGESASASHRLDLALTKALGGGHGEVAVGIADVLDSSRRAIMPIGALTAHETPGRVFFLRAQVRF